MTIPEQRAPAPGESVRPEWHEQLRQERARLSDGQRHRLRSTFTVNRRIARVHFTRHIGTRIPRSVRLFAVPAAVLAIFPFYRDYRCVVLSDCTAEPIGSQLSRSNHEATLLVIETLFGWVADCRSLLTALRAAATRDTAGAPH